MGMGMGHDWHRLEQDDPEMYALLKADHEMERRSLEISHELRQLPTEQRVKKKEELAKLIDQHFDVRQKRRELQIKRMEEELKKLRDAVTKRNDARAEIIGKRLTELTADEGDKDF
jgi:uncharacterized protein YPO0396